MRKIAVTALAIGMASMAMAKPPAASPGQGFPIVRLAFPRNIPEQIRSLGQQIWENPDFRSSVSLARQFWQIRRSVNFAAALQPALLKQVMGLTPKQLAVIQDSLLTTAKLLGIRP